MDIYKTIEVVCTCKTIDQLAAAGRYVALALTRIEDPCIRMRVKASLKGTIARRRLDIRYADSIAGRMDSLLVENHWLRGRFP